MPLPVKPILLGCPFAVQRDMTGETLQQMTTPMPSPDHINLRIMTK